MKLKSLPEDFQVEELSDVTVHRGSFALYRLSKKGLGTPEAISAILSRWNLPRASVGYGGLKDRHASTSQFVSIERGPQINLEERSFSLTYLGQIHRPFVAKDIRANRFAIRLRGIATSEVDETTRRCEFARGNGIVNFFDDQRFGSIGACGELIGVPWCLGNYERALYLAMAEPNSHDRPREAIQKQLLRDHWGDWLECKRILERSHRRSIVTYLVDHPTDFKRALACVRQDLRGIYIAAFQSWVWNRWLSRLIGRAFTADRCVAIPSACGPLLHPARTDEGTSEASQWLERLELPLPSARQPSYPVGTEELLQEILAPLQMDIRQMRLKYPRDTFFSKGYRAAWLRPTQLTYAWQNDDLHPYKQCLNLAFELPRGAYATMIVKAIYSGVMDDPPNEFEDEEDEEDEMETEAMNDTEARNENVEPNSHSSQN